MMKLLPNSGGVMTLSQLFASREEALRLRISKAQFDIYNDELEPHVKSYLMRFYSQRTIDDVPLLTCVNLAKRIVDTEASIYRKAPHRIFSGLTETQQEQMSKIYKDLFIDDVMAEANRYYKLQGITHLYVAAQDEIKVLPLKAHQLHVITDDYDKSKPVSYIMRYGEGWIEYGPDYVAIYSPDFDLLEKTDYGQDGYDLPIIPVKKPFSDTYWPIGGTSVTDFTIQFNALLSDVANIVRMQGFAQAYLKGPRNMLPENIKIGPNSILLLPIDPHNPTNAEFGFANPNPDLAGSLEFLRASLSAFLTSRGLNPRAINTQGASTEYSSGLDRLLSMIDRFEATEADFSVFRKAEEMLFQKLLKIAKSLKLISGPVSSDAAVEVVFQKPESVMTDSDRLDLIIKEKEAGLISDVEAIMKYRGVTKEEAEDIYKTIVTVGLSDERED